MIQQRLFGESAETLTCLLLMCTIMAIYLSEENPQSGHLSSCTWLSIWNGAFWPWCGSKPARSSTRKGFGGGGAVDGPAMCPWWMTCSGLGWDRGGGGRWEGDGCSWLSGSTGWTVDGPAMWSWLAGLGWEGGGGDWWWEGDVGIFLRFLRLLSAGGEKSRGFFRCRGRPANITGSPKTESVHRGETLPGERGTGPKKNKSCSSTIQSANDLTRGCWCSKNTVAQNRCEYKYKSLHEVLGINYHQGRKVQLDKTKSYQLFL